MWQLKRPTWAPGDKGTRQFSWNFCVTVNVCHVSERVGDCCSTPLSLPEFSAGQTARADEALPSATAQKVARQAPSGVSTLCLPYLQ